MSADADGPGAFLPQSPELPPGDLAETLDAGDPVQILDVRAPERLANGAIDQVPPERFHNTRGSEVVRIHAPADTGLDPEIPVVVVCGFGQDSKVVAAHLGRLGFDAASLAGGVVAWMRHSVPRVLDPPQELDRFIQFDRIGKGCLGYLLVSDGEAVIVDPPVHFSAYLEALQESGARLVAVADTHAHADYVSGAPELARRFGVPYSLHPMDAIYPYDGTRGKVEFEAISDGDAIEFGRAALRAMHTPGHTEGSVTYLLEDRVALTGDFLFVESIGRPDLGGRREEWAGQLWDSMARAIRAWGDGLAVYPAHYQCERERRLGRAVGISFGDLLRENEILRIQDPEVFLHHILRGKAPFPDVYRKIKAINLGLEPFLESEVDGLEVGRNECALGGIGPGSR